MSDGIKHLLVINVKGRGYTTFAGSPYTGFTIQPLGAATDVVPGWFVEFQEHFDRLLLRGIAPWSVRLRTTNDLEHVAAYALSLDRPDEFGRSGILFIHAFSSSCDMNLQGGVMAIVKSLTARGIGNISARIAEIAARDASVESFVVETTAGIEEGIPQTRGNMPCLPRGVIELGLMRGVSILHDCAGAASMAWLIQATLRDAAGAEGDVFDYLDHEGQLYTVCDSFDSERIVHASRLLESCFSWGGFLEHPVPVTGVRKRGHSTSSEQTADANTHNSVGQPVVRDAQPTDENCGEASSTNTGSFDGAPEGVFDSLCCQSESRDSLPAQLDASSEDISAVQRRVEGLIREVGDLAGAMRDLTRTGRRDTPSTEEPSSSQKQSSSNEGITILSSDTDDANRELVDLINEVRILSHRDDEMRRVISASAASYRVLVLILVACVAIASNLQLSGFLRVAVTLGCLIVIGLVLWFLKPCRKANRTKRR